MPTIDDYYSRYRELSKTASEVARSLSLAAIGIVWIFKLETPAGIKLPQDLLLPTGFVVLSMLLDFLQYLSLAAIWRLWARHLEKIESTEKLAGRRVDPAKDYRHKKWMPAIGEFFFLTKFVALVVAYVLLGLYIWQKIV